ncbi:Cytochrome c551 peroxidase [Zhongshania aliphaticivorans]|uniref:Cytochrome c551 peroxidase n=1 Tax=Zhongshania aliphaticivorans TaxID=1470434 RepID=A0A5S9NJ12_9GAMM|nr:methanobactin export MATE transporter MbnM [Zhongshania aliphaticivorans]CAA0090333.1 Cytochrome c551 peroxidase [Zhongshania aliphaticivorans]CAA0097758.1 Cytochrome c551 peroxidase [Zhongshania aliphaticivorans]
MANHAYLMVAFAAIFSFTLTACGGGSGTNYQTGDDTELRQFSWGVPDYIPLPIVPEDNPVSEAMFQLGRHLFYDEDLSGNATQACASCHHQSMAFAESIERSIGSTGELHPRNAQSLVNVAFNSTLTWANPSLLTLEQQILVPLFGEFPVEQGITEDNKTEVLARISQKPEYQTLFTEASGNADESINFEVIVKALATFVRGINSFNSDSDKYENGATNTLSDAALRGRELFFSEELECFHCHGGYNFTDSVADSSQLFVDTPFHNTALYNIDGQGAYPEISQGIIEITGKATDMGRFRAPTLRNVAFTAPYMHDGSISTLEEVIRTYAAGGRNIENGPNAGDGRENPFRDGFISGFDIDEDDIQNVIAYLNSLSDFELINNPRFANPWEE